MKYILFLALVLNTVLVASSEVVLGTYSTQESAQNVKSKIDDEIAQDKIFRDFLKKKNIQSTIKEQDNYFIVILGPIDDIVAQKGILKRVKIANFNDAYINTIKESNDEEIIPEKEINLGEYNVAEDNIFEDNSTSQNIDTQEKYPQINNNKTIHQTSSSNNMLNQYIIEIIAAIVILILLVIYLLSNKKNNVHNKLHDYSKLNNSTEDKNIYNNHNLEISYPTSNVIKKEILPHDKITKSDFKKFAGAKIMIAEDNIINQKVINGLLSESQMNIVTLDDGKEVLDYLENDNDFSIILMDAHMPNIDGYEATKRIRSNPKYNHITVIALSGDTSDDDIKKMKSVGMQEHLEKPLKMDSLFDIFSGYIYLNNEKTTSKININDFSELNVVDGLSICGNDKEFYIEILRDFLSKYSNIDIEIEKLIANKSYDNLEVTLLDIAGVSANIGAHKLSDTTKDLRRSIKYLDNEETTKLIKEFKKNLEKLKPEIKSYI